MNPEQLAEYNQMRQEILGRALFHHQQQVIAVILQFLSAAFVVWLNYPTPNWPATELFLLILPLVYAGLAHGYQSNQATMESVASYLNQQYGQMGLKWEEFFGKRKSKQKLISFSKALPLVWPQFLPIFIWLAVGWPTHPLTSTLSIIGIVLLVVTLLNFRFKLKSF